MEQAGWVQLFFQAPAMVASMRPGMLVCLCLPTVVGQDKDYRREFFPVFSVDVHAEQWSMVLPTATWDWRVWLDRMQGVALPFMGPTGIGYPAFKRQDAECVYGRCCLLLGGARMGPCSIAAVSTIPSDGGGRRIPRNDAAVRTWSPPRYPRLFQGGAIGAVQVQIQCSSPW